MSNFFVGKFFSLKRFIFPHSLYPNNAHVYSTITFSSTSSRSQRQRQRQRQRSRCCASSSSKPSPCSRTPTLHTFITGISIQMVSCPLSLHTAFILYKINLLRIVCRRMLWIPGWLVVTYSPFLCTFFKYAILAPISHSRLTSTGPCFQCQRTFASSCRRSSNGEWDWCC